MEQNYINPKKELDSLLNDFKEGKIDKTALINKIRVKDKIPDMPYFRHTKSRAVALYGVKREPIVLYREQWLKLSRVFVGGKECNFNKFFHKFKKKSTH